ncbi:glycosyltransferase family 4 protein [Nostocaceae cyanobacterium CENA357]|uniref:Glycosyltransferase family 4 protein n=1 Tax=Atlanticothrix silvestris CENA357 TaxID=1725252 RepID=A0A8J7HMM2_9CYAN|nr:glycosyltransferase [Atlanticothrix silvestris]MBH8555300.1 glycosyltransferase family 4 protein [Atlanticothrix silvestris CENA357]
MDKITNYIANDTLNLWREEGNRQIPQNFEVFRNLVAQAKDYLKQGNHNMAAIYGDIAVEYASLNQHCGLFVSPELENLLLTIGKEALQSSSHRSENRSLHEMPKNILHIVYGVWNTGGHSRLLWRWIQQDAERSHSVVLTEMRLDDTPKVFREAVYKSHGKIYALNKTIGNFISRAKRLREIAASADMVVLHTMHDGTLPVIAFANREQSPPIIYVNTADERFWTGVCISDVVANLRDSGMRLSQKRRGVEPMRNMVLPTIVEPTRRILSRSEAKRQLGISENSVLLLSIARGVKYNTSDGISFADVHLPLLKKHKQAILMVVGPGNRKDWSEAIQQTQGRIRVFGDTPDTDVFYQAADIYVDSYPFVSITSLLEAGSYGLPLVSRYPYSSDACEIFGADMPGLTGNLIRVQNLGEYTSILSRLVEDEEFRLSLGEATRKKITEIHTANNWQQSLEDVYLRAATLPRINVTSAPQEEIFVGEPDVFLSKVCPFKKIDVEQLILNRVKVMPFDKRFSCWIRQIKMGNFRRISLMNLFAPEWFYENLWLYAHLQKFYRRLRYGSWNPSLPARQR